MKGFKKMLCFILAAIMLCPAVTIPSVQAEDAYLVRITEGFNGYGNANGTTSSVDPYNPDNSVGEYSGYNTSMKWYNPRAYFTDDGESPKVFSARALITEADGSYFEFKLRGSASNENLVQLNANRSVSLRGASSGLTWVPGKWISIFVYIDYSAIDLTDEENPNYVCPMYIHLSSDGGLIDADENPVYSYTDDTKTMNMSGYAQDFNVSNKNSINSSGVIAKESNCKIYLDDTLIYIPDSATASHLTNEDNDYSEELTVNFCHPIDMSTVNTSTISVNSLGGIPAEISEIDCDYGSSSQFTIRFKNKITATGQYVVDLSKVKDITGNSIADNLSFTVEGVTYLPIEAIEISSEDVMEQIYGHTFPVSITADTTPSDGIKVKNVTWYINDVLQDTVGLSFSCGFDDIGTYRIYAKDAESDVVSNTLTLTVEEEKDDVPNRDRYGMSVTDDGTLSAIPPDWKLMVKDNFDVDSEENVSIVNYNGGTGFASAWSANLECTDNSEETFISGQFSGKTYSAPYIEVKNGESYLSRYIVNSSNMAQAEFRKMNTAVNMNEDAEYYLMFDMAFTNCTNIGTAQRFGLIDSNNAGNLITVGSNAEPYVGKMAATAAAGEWGIGSPGRNSPTPKPSKLSPVEGKYTMVMHISSRADANDVIRYRVFFDEVDEEAASFFPAYWSHEYSGYLTYNNLDTLRFSCANGTGSGYQAILDDVVMYKSAAVSVVPDQPGESTLSAGKTLSVSVGAVNSLGHAQKINYISWFDYTDENNVPPALSASASYTIPAEMVGRKLLCLVTVKDLVTGDLTTYAPVNKYVREDLDLQEVFFSSSDGKNGANVADFINASEAYLRIDVTRNSATLTDGYVKLGVLQYSELGALKKAYSAAAVRASSLGVGNTSRMTVTLQADAGSTLAAPGDEFIVVAKYIPGEVTDSDALLSDTTGYDLDFAAEVTDSEYMNTHYVVPGGTQIKIGETWRSALYPIDWQPGYKDEKGRGLQDFSYAGYRRGEVPIPSFSVTGENVYNVVDYGADPTGNADSTSAIQAAIDAAGNNGGGVVYMPEGTFSITYAEGQSYALRMDKSGVVLKGAGDGKTFLYLNETYTRQKNAIYMGGGHTFYAVASNETPLTQDITEPTHAIHVQSTAGFAVGDTVCIGSEKRATQEFCDEHYMSSWYDESGNGKLDSVIFCREVTAVDAENNIIYIDIPTRYYVLMRDGAKIFKPYARTSEQGLEDFSISSKENTKSGTGENDYNSADTCAYESYCSNFILARGITDGWIRNISTYQGKDNGTYGSHIASNVICIHQSNRMTIENVHCKNTRYQGGGGNGYAFDIQGADCLFKNCSTYNTRHGYSFKSMQTTGNVIYNCSSENNKYVDDFHQHLSNANLIDNHYFMTGDRPRFEATNNGTYGSVPHGYTTTESTFWNCETTVVSKQVGMGYAIGCYAVDSSVGPTDNSAPADYVEGTGKGSTLMPQSLYVDQKNRRLSQNQVVINQVYFSDDNNSNQNETGLSPIRTKVKALVSYNEAEAAPTLFAAVYENVDGSPALVSVKLANTPVDYLYETDYFDLTETDTTNCYVKIFVVDDTDSLQPLLEEPIFFNSDGFAQ